MRTLTLTVLCVILGLTGCGKRLSRVSGMVSLDGKPVEGATVTLQPKSGEGSPYGGLTRADGAFEMEAAPGGYKALVSKLVPLEAPAGKTETVMQMKTRAMQRRSALPELYGKFDSSPFDVTVPRESPLSMELSTGDKAPPSAP